MGNEKKKLRLDLRLLHDGLVSSRQKAQAIILSGNVLVDDVPVSKAGEFVSPEAVIRIRGNVNPFVSRGGLKLNEAIKVFDLPVAEKTCLDIGASTGGFTDVLLQRGAKKVYAFDVGHNQLDWKIRNDPRVVVKENFNSRYLTSADLPESVDIVVVDVSFISLVKILPPTLEVSHIDCRWICLIKPQFEVGKGKVGKGGIVLSSEDRLAAVENIRNFCESNGFRVLNLIESPIKGADGNVEYLIYLAKNNGI